MKEHPNHKLDDLLDKDGLMFSCHLEVVPHPRGDLTRVFRVRGNKSAGLLFPTPEIGGVLELITEDRQLWEASRVRVLREEWRQKRLPVFGPCFRAAVKIAVSKGFVKSRFALADPQRFDGSGLVADLIVHVGRLAESDETTLQLEAWEPLGNDGETFYLHAIFGRDVSTFTHLDGAVIWFAPDDLTRLVNEGRKLKGSRYQKQFRLDGRIPADVVFEVVRRYLPVSELVDEFFFEVSQVVATPSNHALEPSAGG